MESHSMKIVEFLMVLVIRRPHRPLKVESECRKPLKK
nr:MAG TPA: hypothetical protein [Caudoviricetes sp.]